MTESGSYEGYSFAVPSNLVQKVIRDLKEFGVVQRAYLGVGIQDVDAEVARELELPSVQGVLVNRIINGGAASDAGMAPGDVILSVNSIRVNSTAELQEHVGRFRPGESVNLEFWRKGQSIRNTVTLKDGNNNTRVALVRGDELDQDLGISLRDLTREEERKMHVQGAIVTSIRRGSVVYETNMQPGFVICSVNGNRVKDAADAIEAIRNAYNKLVLDGYYEGEPDLYSYRFRK
jgi:S1-C subfamily serine protease